VLRLLDSLKIKVRRLVRLATFLEAHIQALPSRQSTRFEFIGFDRVIGTSGSIRTLRRAANLLPAAILGNSVNARNQFNSKTSNA